MKKETLKKQLIALGADALAELLMAEANENPALRKQLDLALIKTDPQRLAKKLRQQISGIKRAKRFIEWRQAKAFMRDLYTPYGAKTRTDFVTNSQIDAIHFIHYHAMRLAAGSRCWNDRARCYRKQP